MASLVYDLKLTGHALGSNYTYACTESGPNGPATLGATLPGDELVAKFGLVPESIRITVRVLNETPPADAWLDTPKDQIQAGTLRNLPADTAE